jgi:phospholipid/cholesterol/gamma-HCH transport system substrate-binding protein
MKRETINTVRLGLFVLTGSILLIIGISFIGSRQNLFGSTFTISTIFKNAGGLQPGNNVRYAGINVGTVADIVIVTDSTLRLDLKLVSRVQPFIKKNAIATLSVDGIVGSAIVNIRPGFGDAPSVEDGDIIPAETLPGTIDLISTLGSTNDNISLFVLDLLTISGRMKEGPGTISDLLQDSLMANDLKNTIRNLENTSRITVEMMSRLNHTISQMEQHQGLINQLIYDTTIMSNVRHLSEELDQTLVNKLDTIIQKLNTSGDHLTNATQRLDNMMEDIQGGEGVVHDLIYNQENAQSLQSTLKNIEEGTALFKEDMKALQENFLFRRYFRKQRKQEIRDSLERNP